MTLLIKFKQLIDFVASEDKIQCKQKQLITSTNELLAFGYIREIEHTLTDTQIVPLSIIQMIMTYYYTVGEIKIILSTKTQRGSCHTLQYIDFQQDKAILFNVGEQDHIPRHYNGTQTCFIKNIEPPQYLFSNPFFTQNEAYSAIINDMDSILYFQTKDLGNASHKIDAFCTTLPENRWFNQYSYNFAKLYREYIYSESHGLICFDGNTLFQMLFDSEVSFDKRKWNKLAETSVVQNNASLCWIKKYSFESSLNDTLFICGGDGMKIANLFKIKDRTFMELKSMPNARTRAGSYYDFFNQRIYIGGGGHGSSYNVDCYDVNSDRWFVYPDTLYPHSSNPILWMDGYVLFICGHQSNIGCVERYDIRSNDNYWSLADKMLQIDRLIIPCDIERVLLGHY